MEVAISIVTGILSAVLAAGGAVWASGRRAGTLQGQVQAVGDRLGDRLGAVEREVSELRRATERRCESHDERLRVVETRSAAHDACPHWMAGGAR